MSDNLLTKKYKTDEIKLKMSQNGVSIYDFYLSKLEYYRDVLLNITIDLNSRVNYKYISKTENILCLEECRRVYTKINECYAFLKSDELMTTNTCTQTELLQENISKLQEINDVINNIIRLYGCYSLEQVIIICFGNEYYTSLKKEQLYDKQLLLNKYFHPTSFKCLAWKNETYSPSYLVKNKIIDDNNIVESAYNFDCFDLSRTSLVIEQKITGIKVVYQNKDIKRTLIITGYIEPSVDIKCITNSYIQELDGSMYKNKSLDVDVADETYKNYVDMLSLKECLIYNTNELHKNFIGLKNQYELTKSKPMSQVVTDFMNMELILQIKFIKNLIIHKHNTNAYYLCGILLGLLNDDNNGTIITNTQDKVYDALPHECQKYIKQLISNYTEKTAVNKKFNVNKIPYEQQIELLITSDDIKEKAYSKLKEVMTKSEESGGKAKLYLEGLLKIPFGTYKQEPLLKSKEYLINTLSNLYTIFEEFTGYLETKGISLSDINGITMIDEPKKTNTLRFNEIKRVCNNLEDDLYTILRFVLTTLCNMLSRPDVKDKIEKYNTIVKDIKMKYKYNSYIKKLKKINTTGKKRSEMIVDFVETFSENLREVFSLYKVVGDDGDSGNENSIDKKIVREINEQLFVNIIYDKSFFVALDKCYSYMIEMKTTMLKLNNLRKNALTNIDNCIYGHKNAKSQIKNIINQWITGENSGYCFGFEGPPGVGKTSIAKLGLTKCLEGEDGEFRPLDFIAIGGTTNGSYLSGHSYTYLGSTWGRIVEILMNKKCLNPIIFIDELDKVSHSEYGKEIIGILTHLVDPTQNNMFQDKYFSGINIDLSKALFIFSYNDAALIDPILLDRIHRIKFDNLSPYDKLVICNSYLIPESNKRFGFSDGFIRTDDKTILFLIDNYTYESGVRKLKQLLFEIWGNINELLLNDEIDKDEYVLTEKLIEKIFLKEHHKITRIKINEQPTIGIINGLWANALGLGGLTPIQIKWFPCKTPLELKLTGMQGDVMKESMNVAKTVAWDMLSPDEKKSVWENVYSESGPCYGIHIHCPEGSVNKDGPSAGGAITTCLLSMYKNKYISNKFAMTGEINLSGDITAIGGLEQKLYYGIGAGATLFAFPEENLKDFELFKEKYADKIYNFKNIIFYPVKTIYDVYNIVF